MPMDFPDMNSLKSAAKVHAFRQPNEGESEAEYRSALADHVESRDFVESCEIRSSRGWDKFSEADTLSMLSRSFQRNRLAGKGQSSEERGKVAWERLTKIRSMHSI